MSKKDSNDINAQLQVLRDQIDSVDDEMVKLLNKRAEVVLQVGHVKGKERGQFYVPKREKQVIDRLTEQLKAKALKDQQFAEAVEKIPAETMRQTNTLIDMNQKLSAAVDVDAQMAEGFNRFNETLSKLDDDTVSQSDSIKQMSKTFAASDRHLKYLVSKYNKRFVWVFIVAMVVCVVAIAGLAVGIVMVLSR